MTRTIGILLLATALLGAGAVPAELRKAAALAQNDHRGIIAYIATWESQARGGPFHRWFRYRNGYVFDGTRFVEARALERNDNGKIASAKDLDAETKRLNDAYRQHSADALAVPFDAAHFNEYRYTVLPCTAACRSGETEISFTALRSDARHADGMFIINHDGRVRHMEYVPKLMPSFGIARAQQAHFSVDRGEVLPGFWADVFAQNDFSGRYGMVTGEMHQTAHMDHFHRYAAVEAAQAALRSGAL